jgi:uncharacterized protein YxjI
MKAEDLLDQEVVKNTSMKEFEFPLDFEFKVSSFANDFTAKDANGKTLAYVRQKMFKLKEAISVFQDTSKEKLLYTINADRIIDFSANYLFKQNDGTSLGRVGRKGAKSILKAHYEVFDNEDVLEFIINEENPWAKVGDAFLSEIPVVGIFTGYMFNPKYIVKRPDGTEVARLSKEKSFMGRRFKLSKLGEIQEGESERMLLALMMMSLLERRRG